ncbi:MAG: hypothetical protein A2096_02715, partial [Spirochaetes bacterium GWF1_41_5]
MILFLNRNNGGGMDFIQELKQKVRKNPKTVILAEGTEPRMHKAAEALVKEKLVKEVFLTGRDSEVLAVAKKEGIDLSGISIIDPEKFSGLDRFAAEYYNLRKHKGVSEQDAREAVKKDLIFSALHVRLGLSDGMVAGAVSTTADVSRTAVTVVQPRPGIKYISSFFIMVTPREEYGEKGVFIYSDCGLIPEPSAEQLKDIAIASARNARLLCGMEPRVALLSFSTKGSAKHPSIDKVIKARELLDQGQVDFIYD